MAERAGHATPHRFQKFLGEAPWGAGTLLAEVQDYIAGRLGDVQATLVLDDTQVIKKGTRSVGVAHQHWLRSGEVTVFVDGFEQRLMIKEHTHDHEI
jgi:SRSO17 transposase